MILRHRCGKPATVNLSNSLKIEGIPSLSGNKIRIVSMVMDVKKNVVLEFYCNYCNTPFNYEELLITCIECDRLIEDDILLESPFGGVLCPDCAEKYEIKTKKINKKELVLE